MSLKSAVEKAPFYNTLVKPVHFAQAVVAATKNDFPGKKMRVIAVTGTNGKTTTCFMIWKMLNEAGRKAGLLTTVGWGGVGLAQNTLSPSSADALLTHRTLSTARSATPASSDKMPSEQDRRSSSVRCSNSPRTSSEISAPTSSASLDKTSSEQDQEFSSEISATTGDDALGATLDATVLHQQFEHMTTERVGVLNERMRAIYEAGAEFLVLETTSHALSQSRIWGVPVEIAVFTNLTHEHLDYHKTMEKYRKAKMKLFERAKYGVVNADDESWKWFAEAVAKNGKVGRSDKTTGDCERVTTYGIENGEMRATDIKLKTTGVKYTCDGMTIETQIPGRFNVYNSLAAVCVGRRVGLGDKEIEKGIAALEAVEGRMNRINEGQDFEVIVDYAHQPDALEKVFASMERSDTATPRRGRIIAVHGGAGRRDPSTREPRGEILGKNSDIVIITEDDSRDEDPVEIAEMFVRGAEKVGKVRDKDLFVELDREKAISKAIGMAKKGDVVLILGKGHEKTILRADGPHEFEDIKVAKKTLRQRQRL